MINHYKPWLLISNSHQAVWMISKAHPPIGNVSQAKMDLVNKQFCFCFLLVAFVLLCFVFVSGFFGFWCFVFFFLHKTSPRFFFSVLSTIGNRDQTHEQTSQIILQSQGAIKEMGFSILFLFFFPPFSIVWALTGKLWKRIIVLRATEGLHVCFCSRLAFSSLHGPISSFSHLETRYAWARYSCAKGANVKVLPKLTQPAWVVSLSSQVTHLVEGLEQLQCQSSLHTESAS